MNSNSLSVFISVSVSQNTWFNFTWAGSYSVLLVLYFSANPFFYISYFYNSDRYYRISFIVIILEDLIYLYWKNCATRAVKLKSEFYQETF